MVALTGALSRPSSVSSAYALTVFDRTQVLRRLG